MKNQVPWERERERERERKREGDRVSRIRGAVDLLEAEALIYLREKDNFSNSFKKGNGKPESGEGFQTRELG